MPQWWSIDREAAQMILVSFEASLEACFVNASGEVLETLGMEPGGGVVNAGKNLDSEWVVQIWVRRGKRAL